MVFNLAYYTLGVGFREEFCKMLFFLPLIPWLKKENCHHKILTFASLVGLGFAIEENFAYFMRSPGDPVIMGRFLTANLLHMFMTGFICYHLTLAFKHGGKYWDLFTSSFIKMVVAHGVYDFLLSDPKMVQSGMSFFAMTLLIWLSMRYIQLMVHAAPPHHRYVSLTRLFTLILCLTIGISYLMMSLDIGIIPALKASINGLISSAIFAYMFYREFNEPIAP